jgi:aerobic carbon-monoxide dehydrogenase large subunit
MTDDRKRSFAPGGADVGRGLRPKNIGARVRRVEDPRLLAGPGTFTDDRIVPGALHLALRRSDHAHALIFGIGSAAAAGMPGVFGVCAAKDLDDLVGPLRAPSRMPDCHATALYALARDKVRYVGEPVVAVLAETRYRAEDARERIEIAYKPLGIVIDPETVAGEGAPLLHEAAGTNVLAKREFARGDLAAVLAAAPLRSAAASGSSGRRRSRGRTRLDSPNTIAGAVR